MPKFKYKFFWKTKKFIEYLIEKGIFETMCISIYDRKTTKKPYEVRYFRFFNRILDFLKM